MSYDQLAIRVVNVTKIYKIYERPIDRLKQFLLPVLRSFFRPKIFCREHPALNDISFELRKGESLGVIGANGSGKSTLLQIICGTLTPSTGFVHINGRIAAILELGSGFNPEFTGRENIYLNASLLGLTNQEIDERFEKIASFADIGEFIERPVRTYSSGMVIRLAFAVIAHVDADILVVDEALAVGDMMFTQKCMRFIQEFKKSKTLIFVSHDLGAISAVSDKCIWLKNGKKIAESNVADILNMYSLSAIKNDLPEFNQENNQTLDLGSINKSRIEGGRLVSEITNKNQINLQSKSAGEGKASIVSAYFSVNESPVKEFKGEECVKLVYLIRVDSSLDGILLGYTIKDKTGLKIIEENNIEFIKQKKIASEPGNFIVANFVFNMPILKNGEYSVDLAIAEGSYDVYTHQNWYFDAIQFTMNPQLDVTGIFSAAPLSFDFLRLGNV